MAPAAGWSSWGLEVSQGLWGVLLLRSCAENHGGPKRLFRFRWRLRLSALSGALLFTRIALDLGRLRADLARDCHQVCKAAGLLPLPTPEGNNTPRAAATP